MKTAKATLQSGQTIEYFVDPIGEGGMKVVHFTVDKSSVACFFKDKNTGSDPERLRRLESILGKYNPTTDPRTGDYWKGLFCWPTAIITQPELGILAPVYPQNYFFASGNWQGKEKEGKWFTSPKLRKMLPDSEKGTWISYLSLCICISRAVRRLHSAGLAHSDLSNKNCLVDPSMGTSIVIDIDGLVVPQVHPPDVLGTPGYIAPEVVATQHLPVGDANRVLPSSATDQYALAVLIYEYLLGRHPLRGPKVNSTQSAEEDERLSMGTKALFIEHPSDQSNRPGGLTYGYKSMGPLIAPLFERAFIDGLHDPSTRPTAHEWEGALMKSWDLLIECKGVNCQSKWFVFNDSVPPRCPFCGWRLHGAMPILHLYTERKAGQYVSERRPIVVRHNQWIFPWHIYKDALQGELADRKARGYFSYYDDRWYLVNQNTDSMEVIGCGPVPPGSAVELEDGRQIRLSTAPNGRLAVVQMVRA